jgi:hypothetical protein
MDDFDKILSESLRAVRDEHIQTVTSSVPAARREVLQRVRRRQFRFVITSSAVTAAALVAVLLITQVKPLSKKTSLPPASSRPAVVASYYWDQTPTDVAATSDAVWVAGTSRGELGYIVSTNWQVARLDPSQESFEPVLSGTFAGEVMPEDALTSLWASEGDIYASMDGSLSRITHDDVAASGGPEVGTGDIAVTSEFVWYSSANGSETGFLDPKTLEPISDPQSAGPGSIEQVASFGGVNLELKRSKAPSPELIRVDDPKGVAPEFGHGTPLFPSQGSAAMEMSAATVWVIEEGTESGDVLVRVPRTPQSAPSTEPSPSGVAGDCDAAGGNDCPETPLNPSDDPKPEIVELPVRPLDIALDGDDVWVVGNAGGDVETNQLVHLDPSGKMIGEPLDVGNVGPAAVAVGNGGVWVTNANDSTLLKVDPEGASPSPEPTVSDEPSPDPSPSETQTSVDCSDVPFTPGFFPEGMSSNVGLGSGGQEGVPLSDQAFGSPVMHWGEVDVGSGGYGDVVDVVVGEPPYPPGTEDIEVLGGTAKFGGIEDGYMTDITIDGCRYALLEYMSEDNARKFAENLVFEGDASVDNDGFAIWPRHEPEDAYLYCNNNDNAGFSKKNGQLTQDAADEDTRTIEAMAAAGLFATDVLGWTGDPHPIEAPYDLPADQRGFTLTGPEQNHMNVVLRELVPSCWFVTGVSPADQDPNSPTGLSVGKDNKGLRVGISIADRNIQGDLAKLVMETPDGSRLRTTAAEAGSDQDEAVLTIPLTQMSSPTYFLIYFEDQDGNVLNADGGSLPSGDFAAG